MKNKVKVIDTKQFETEKVKKFIKISIQVNTPYAQGIYADIWLRAFNLFQNKKLNIEELAKIGQILQLRIPTGKNLGWLNKYNLFDVLEHCNSLLFYIGAKEMSQDKLDIEKKRLVDMGNELQDRIEKAREKLEKSYETNLLSLISQYINKVLNIEEFVEEATTLGEKLDEDSQKKYYGLNDFKDLELGWAKYWIEETSYYGIESVMKDHFDFVEFYNKRTGDPNG